MNRNLVAIDEIDRRVEALGQNDQIGQNDESIMAEIN